MKAEHLALLRPVDRQSSLQNGRFITSLDKPIGAAFLSDAPRSVNEVHLIAPFFEQAASVDSIDTGWLEKLRTEFPQANYHVYLPQVESGKKPVVQGEKELFKKFLSNLPSDEKLRFYPIRPDPGPLHGKLIALVYQRGRVRRARTLVGSPNPSRQALLALKGNVEAAWITDIKASALRAFFSSLNVGRGRSLDALRFRPAKRSFEKAWSALSRVVLDPRESELSLTWMEGYARENTKVFYGERELKVGNGDHVKEFTLDTVNGALTTRPKRNKIKKIGHVVQGYCPIEVSHLDQLLIGTFKKEMTPYDWLSLLGNDPGTKLASTTSKGHYKSKGVKQIKSDAFPISDQVRDLAARLRHTLQKLKTPFWSSAECAATLSVLKGIFDSHSLNEPGLSDKEQIWRGWVRVELVHFAAAAAGDHEVRSQGLAPTLKAFVNDHLGRLDLGNLPAVPRKQLLLVARAIS